MNIVLISHPNFASSQSMPRFARMLKVAYQSRGHSVEMWSPSAKLYNWFPLGRLSKWAGYVDQYLLFPIEMRRRLTRTSKDTLFVFCDQALGPLVPVVQGRPCVVHVHDLLALRSALGEVPENPTAITGRIYQRYIRRGFQMARHFISISRQTQSDLHRVGRVSAITSEVVYNGLNFPYAPLPPDESAEILVGAGLPVPRSGMLLHVGGGQWYKNLPGVIHLYAHYAAEAEAPLPLWCVSPQSSEEVRSALRKVAPAGTVLFFNNLDSRVLQAAYSMAHAFLFPSIAEGFGWPLIEAQACGCPVITTSEPPMNEVAGDAAVYIPRLTLSTDIDEWAAHAAKVLRKLLAEGLAAKETRREAGKSWARRFDPDGAIDSYLAVYDRVCNIPAGSYDFKHSLNPGAPT